MSDFIEPAPAVQVASAAILLLSAAELQENAFTSYLTALRESSIHVTLRCVEVYRLDDLQRSRLVSLLRVGPGHLLAVTPDPPRSEPIDDGAKSPSAS